MPKTYRIRVWTPAWRNYYRIVVVALFDERHSFAIHLFNGILCIFFITS